MTVIYPERISQARELTGKSKSDLAGLLSVSPAAVSQWENGSKRPTVENLESLARFLRVSPLFFTTPVPDNTKVRGPITFRSHASAKSRRLNKKSEKLGELAVEALLYLNEFVEFPAANIPCIDGSRVCSNEAVEEAATQTRRAWNLGDKPIHKLGELLEAKGITIFYTKFKDERVDAFSMYVDGLPIIFLGSDKEDRARSRFDTCHELGHLVLHQHLTTDDLLSKDTLKVVENQANYFSTAFLLPAESFSKDVIDISLNGFLMLKPKWGVSAQAMIYRAKNLKIIDDDTAGRLFRAASARGMRKAKGEPYDDYVPPVSNQFIRRVVDLLEERKVISESQLLSECTLPEEVIETVFGIRENEPLLPDNLIKFPFNSSKF